MELPNRPTKDPYQEIPVKDFSYINTGQKSAKKSGRPLYTALLVLVLVLLGVGAFFYGHYTKTKITKHPKTTAHNVVVTQNSLSSNPQLTNYTSPLFNFTVSYPTSWAVAAGASSLAITSPITNLTSDTGKSVQGKIAVNFYKQGQIPAGFGSTSVAVLNSQVVSYSNPTSSQAAQTYLSFVQYPATTVVGGMDGIYVTGNNGYQKYGTIPPTDINKVNPLIFVDFTLCSDQACSSSTPLTISSTMWSNAQFSTPIITIIKSLQFS